jgi:hypothetical protein
MSPETYKKRAMTRDPSSHRVMLHDAAVCCHLCDPPQRVEVPARVFYRLRDSDFIACPNGHQGTLLEYKHAACHLATPHGPFIRYDHHPADWATDDR